MTKYWGQKAAGIMFVCSEDGTIFLTQRSQDVHNPGQWSIPGGALNEGFFSADDDVKDPSDKVFLAAAKKETLEELKSLPDIKKLLTITDYIDGSFTYKTFVCDITLKSKKDWHPKLNWENSGYAWFDVDDLPDVHPGVKFTLGQQMHF